MPEKKLHVNGNSQIDGTTQTSALKITGTGRVFDVAGRIHAGQATSGANPGFITIRGPNGELNVVLASLHDGSPNEGVIGVLDENGRTVAFVESEDGLGVIGVLHDDIQKAVMFVDEGKGIIEADEIRADVKHMRVPNPKQPDTDIVYTCIEGPEAAVYSRGTARLLNGKAVVTLPDHFASVASGQGMTVQITPLSVKSLGVAVVEKHRTRFVVKELQSGAGTYDFDWEVKAVRMGHEKYEVIRPHRKRAQKPYAIE
jgi:hypothetical protein